MVVREKYSSNRTWTVISWVTEPAGQPAISQPNGLYVHHPFIWNVRIYKNVGFYGNFFLKGHKQKVPRSKKRPKCAIANLACFSKQLVASILTVGSKLCRCSHFFYGSRPQYCNAREEERMNVPLYKQNVPPVCCSTSKWVRCAACPTIPADRASTVVHYFHVRLAAAHNVWQLYHYCTPSTLGKNYTQFFYRVFSLRSRYFFYRVFSLRSRSKDDALWVYFLSVCLVWRMRWSIFFSLFIFLFGLWNKIS